MKILVTRYFCILLAYMGLLLRAWYFHTQGLIVWVLPYSVIDIWSYGWHFYGDSSWLRRSPCLRLQGSQAAELAEHHHSQFQNNFHYPNKKP